MTENTRNTTGAEVASNSAFDLTFDDTCHCKFCSIFFTKSNVFKSEVTGKCHKIKPPNNGSLKLNCKTKNVIYLISCQKCNIQYVGMTIQTIKARFCQHKSCIATNKLNTFLCNHFNSNDHSYEDCRIQIIDFIENSDGKDKASLAHDLRIMEDYWIKVLNSAYPFGLNDRLLGFGDVRRSDFNSLNNSNTPFFDNVANISRRKRSHGHRKPRKQRLFSNVGISELIKSLLPLYNKGRKYLYVALRGFSTKDLFKLNEHLGLNITCQEVPLNFKEMIFAYTSNIRKAPVKSKNMNDRLFCSVPFVHKIIDSLNIQSIFSLKYVQQMIPDNCKFYKSPIVSFKYGKTIGQSVLNYKNTLLNISEKDIFSHESCDCLTNYKYTNFVDSFHKHVFTGDLNIVENLPLRSLLKKGTKFRECPVLDINKIFSTLCLSMERFATKWAQKEKKNITEFQGWLTNVKKVIKDKLYALRSKRLEYPSCILKKLSVSNDLKELQNRFVICPIDKASNNFGLICKKYYIEILKKELGIDNNVGIKGNKVYLPINKNMNDIINLHNNDLSKNYNIQILDKDLNIPLLFWIPKLHKNPIKSRFIAGASNCTTKKLSVEVTQCLITVRNHFRKYCSTINRHTGINCFWSINNSMEFISKIKNIKAKRINCFDFSTLYTNLPISNLKIVLEKLIIKMFLHSGHKYINVNSNKKQSFWSEKYCTQNNWKSYTVESLISSINFLLDNTFIKFGPFLFQQIQGIPMGSNCSPLLADLYLSWLEFDYMKNLIKSDFSLAKRLSLVSRYIDDIACPNVENFISIAKQIYPKEIPLQCNDSDQNHDIFLDVDISIVNDNFVTKIYHKIDNFKFDVVNYPFPDSNICLKIGYNTFFSQLLRFYRISVLSKDFAYRVKFVYNKLTLRGYEDKHLNRCFYAFCSRNPEILSKFAFSDFKTFWTFCIT